MAATASSPYKLGKRPLVRKLSTPALSNFLPRAIDWPAVKPRGWEYAPIPVPLDMLGNDTVGDCVIAMAMHYAQNETAWTDNPLIPTKALALETYSIVTGYDPNAAPDANGNNPTDQGTDIQGQLMPYWMKTGMPMLDKNGKTVMHTITGFAALDLSSIAQQRYANDIFGGVCMGINCPQSALNNTQNWTYDPTSPIEGGHGINMVGQGSAGWHINSWGLLIPGTWQFSQKLMDEAYIVVTPLWLESAQGQSPSGLDLNGLLAAMKQISAS
jgi:hypothetical protein